MRHLSLVISVLILFTAIISILCGCSSTGTSVSSSSPEIQGPAPTSLRCLHKTNLNFGGSGSDFGYYTMNEAVLPDGSSNILYSDFKTHQSAFLCSQANCTHDSDACTSWVPYSGGGAVPLVLNDNLLLAYFGNPDYVDKIGSNAIPHFEIMELNGSNRKPLAELEANQVIREPFITDDIYLYFSVTTYGKDGTENTFVRLNPSDGSISQICAFEDEGEYVLGAVDQSIITIQYLENATAALCKHDIITSDVEQLQKWELGQRRFALFDNEFVYIQMQDREVHVFDLQTQKDRLIAAHVLEQIDLMDIWIGESSDNHILICGNVRDEKGTVEKVTAVAINQADSNSNENWSLIYPYYDSELPMTIAAKVPDQNAYFILANESNTEQSITAYQEGVPYYFPSLQRTFATISIEDYWNGINNIEVLSRLD